MPHKDPEQRKAYHKAYNKQWSKTPQARARKKASRTRFPYTCQRCQTPFVGRKDAKFCSRTCVGKSLWERGIQNQFHPAHPMKMGKQGKYITLRIPGHPMADKQGRLREHRFVMAQHLGRILLPNEVVHHVNGDTQDNRIENLVLTTNKLHAHLHMEPTP